jgi:hypothetical protein
MPQNSDLRPVGLNFLGHGGFGWLDRFSLLRGLRLTDRRSLPESFDLPLRRFPL